jgi:cyclophilin family peptidyl-prolyl cis-trans isomerase/HEAT repeat protein
MADQDEEVRRLTMVAARAEVDGRNSVVAKGLVDPNPRVRYEALQTRGRILQQTSCDAAITAVRDANPHVALLAIDLLGNGCAGQAAPVLRDLAMSSIDGPRSWHRPAHALVSLARIAPADARPLLPQFVTHRIWQVRMYAARAAAALTDVETLSRLARDEHHNVREAALDGLILLKRSEVVRLAVDALSSTDYQLIRTAARALSSGGEGATTVPALQKAFDRIAAEQRDTSRDALNAIRDALQQLGVPPPPEPRPAPLKPQRFRSDDLEALSNARLRFTMSGLGTFELRLLPEEAPVTSSHIATLARTGYYNGLTFHRVVPNFVIQGGSPGANEYAGQGPFMRDEVGLRSHRRGTVGISTRGRDTGDAQIFINLVDLPRLDHTYTVFAEVVSGMDVVDAILEGDVIATVEVIGPS